MDAHMVLKLRSSSSIKEKHYGVCNENESKRINCEGEYI